MSPLPVILPLLLLLNIKLQADSYQLSHKGSSIQSIYQCPLVLEEQQLVIFLSTVWVDFFHVRIFLTRLPWWSSGGEPTCQFWGGGFNPWSGN